MRRTSHWLLPIAIGTALALSGCPDEDETTPVVEAMPDAQGADALDGASPDSAEPAPTGRAPRRLTVEQLARSIPVITGGLAWEEDFGEGPVDMLQLLSGTLGAPDYLLVTEESLEPSLIIAKFMTDAAHRVCARWIERDKTLPAAQRTLIVHDDWASMDAEDVEASLAQLHVRFFSRPIGPDEVHVLAPWETLFFAAADAAPAGVAADDGWFAVCIGMMTSPETVLY